LDTKRAQGEFPGLNKKAIAVVAHNGIAVAGSMWIWKTTASLLHLITVNNELIPGFE
jgi:hypothetical protein